MTLTVKEWQIITSCLKNKGNTIPAWIEILSQLTLKTEEQLKETSLNELSDLIKPYKDAIEQAVMNSDAMPKTWKHRGKSYVCKTDLDKLTAGQLVDYMAVMDMGNIEENLHKLLAVFWHESKKGYDAVNFAARADFIRNNMPIDLALVTSNFFLQLYLNLQPIIQKFLKDQEVQLAGTKKRGDGL